jgi:transposase
LSGVTIIAMDEFVIRKGHRYATVIVEPTSKRVLWAGRGRSREEIRVPRKLVKNHKRGREFFPGPFFI